MINFIIILISAIDTILIGKFGEFFDYYFPITVPMNDGQGIMIVYLLIWIVLNISSFLFILLRQKKSMKSIVMKIVGSSIITQLTMFIINKVIWIYPVYKIFKPISKIIYKTDVFQILLSVLCIILLLCMAKGIIFIIKICKRKG